MGKNKAQAPTLPRIRHMSCFDLTHAPVATAARSAATGPVSMLTRHTNPKNLMLGRWAWQKTTGRSTLLLVRLRRSRHQLGVFLYIKYLIGRNTLEFELSFYCRLVQV